MAPYGMTQADVHPLLVTYTLFPHVWPTEKTERADTPWEALVARIKDAAIYIDKAHCPLISMAEYGDEIDREHKCLRYGENVRRVFGVEVDYDGEKIPLPEAARVLQAANIKAILYTSPSHRPEAPRWRVLLPLSEATLPEKRAEYVGRANRILGGIATRESFTLSQSFYIGRVRGATYEVLETEGRTIDMAAEIEPQYAHLRDANGHGDRDGRSDSELRAAFERGEGRYEAMLKLSSRWAARGMAVDDIESSLIHMLGAQPHNSEGIDLRTRCRPMAESALRKFGGRQSIAEDSEPVPQEAKSERPVRYPMRWSELQEREPPIRIWRINYWLTVGPTLLAGAGGIGKTIIAQTVATALALGRRFLDDVHQSLRVLFWACEDDHDELWRRQLAICRFFGVQLSALEGRLVIEPRLGRDNTLFALQFGSPGWTPLRLELAAQVADYRADVLFLDNIGQTFGGSENDRHHVTAFVNGLAGLAPGRPLSAVLMGHPAKQAGSEFSGSTAWENAVRMRWYMGMKLPDEKPEEAAPEEPNVRFLAKRKTNYTVKDYRKLTYQEGVFRPEDEGGEFTQRYSFVQRGEGAQECILHALDRFAEAGIRSTDGRTSPDYLPKKMREMKLAADFTPRELSDALSQLRLAGRVAEGIVGKYDNRNPKRGLRRTA